MSALASILLVYGALALQATLIPALGIAGIRPDLPLVAVTLVALSRGAATGTITGFLVGLAQDLGNPGFLGLNALAKCLVGHTVGTLRGRFDAGTALSHALVLGAATVAHDLVYLTIHRRLVLSEIFLALGTHTLPTALYTAVVGSLLAVLLAALAGRRSHRFGRSQLANR